jgi:hypothetical protein
MRRRSGFAVQYDPRSASRANGGVASMARWRGVAERWRDAVAGEPHARTCFARFPTALIAEKKSHAGEILCEKPLSVFAARVRIRVRSFRPDAASPQRSRRPPMTQLFECIDGPYRGFIVTVAENQHKVQVRDLAGAMQPEWYEIDSSNGRSAPSLIWVPAATANVSAAAAPARH